MPRFEIEKELAYKKIKFVPTTIGDLLESFLRRNGTNYDDFVTTYTKIFNTQKKKIEVVSEVGAEKSRINPVVQGILEMALEMVRAIHPNFGGYYEFVHEHQVNKMISQSLVHETIPDFTIHVKAQFSQEHPSFFSCVLPIECKKIDHSGEAGFRYSITFALEHLKECMELSRDIDTPLEAFSITTDGYFISLNLVTIEERCLVHRGNDSMYADSLLLPDNLNDVRNADLANLPGLVAILAILTFPNCYAQKGFPPTEFSWCCNEQRISLRGILGMGGLSSVLIARQKNRKAQKEFA